MSAAPVIEIEAQFASPPGRVWAQWTDPDALSEWLSAAANVRLEPGGPFELFWEPAAPRRNSTLGCRILEINAPFTLVFEWRGPEMFADLMNTTPLPTWVRVALEETAAGGTRLRLHHRGWGTGARWDAARLWQDQAWRLSLARLGERVQCV